MTDRIFLCEDEKVIGRVYGEELTEELGVGSRVWNKKSLLDEPARFAQVEYVFSTWGMPKLTEEEIRRCLPSLKAVFYAAGSVQEFARPFIESGVKVFSAWAANGVPVAEYTFAQVILANKGFFRVTGYSDREGFSAAWKADDLYPGNYGVKVGVIGAGMIGKLVIQKLKALDVETLVFDPFLPDEEAKRLGVEKTSLERVFSECSVVTNHMANNEQTRGMLTGRLFASMLPHATFINTGRGAQVVESEMTAVLKARPDLTVLLDVTYPEPPEEGSELYSLENVVLTPHIAGSRSNEVRRMGRYMAEEFFAFSQGRPCRYEVTAKMLETMA